MTGKEDKESRPLDEQDIKIIKKYGMGPYGNIIKEREEENGDLLKEVNKLSGIKESDTGLGLPS